MLRLAIDSISQTSTKYTANDFFVKKQIISTDMAASLNYTLTQQVNMQIVFFQLLSIDLPDLYESSI